MTQAFLPQFRQRKTGVIVNVTSSVTYKSFPMLSVYTASKAAVNAFSESLALELEPFNVRVRVVVPGQAPETSFGKNAQAWMQKQDITTPEAYAELARSVFARMTAGFSSQVTQSVDVAEAVWFAANDPSCPTQIPAGADAVELAKANRS